MDFSKTAIDHLTANIEPFSDAASDHEKYNLHMGLINLAKAIAEIEKRLNRLEQRSDGMNVRGFSLKHN